MRQKLNVKSHALIRPTPRRQPPEVQRSWYKWVVSNFFQNYQNTIQTLIVLWVLWSIIPRVLQWGIFDAVWFTHDPDVCKAAGGACWSVIPEKYRVMLFGTYPYDQHWRGMLSSFLIVLMTCITAARLLSLRIIVVAWAGTMVLVITLMAGGVLGLSPVPTHDW